MNTYDPKDPYWISVDEGICAKCGSKKFMDLAIVVQCLDCESIQMPPLNSETIKNFLDGYLAKKEDK